jgi:hypothetical protein
MVRPLLPFHKVRYSRVTQRTVQTPPVHFFYLAWRPVAASELIYRSTPPFTFRGISSPHIGLHGMQRTSPPSDDSAMPHHASPEDFKAYLNQLDHVDFASLNEPYGNLLRRELPELTSS